MIRDFETVKSQLSDLAGVINQFKSEAVQLRIVELVLGRAEEREARERPAPHPAPKESPGRPKRRGAKPRVTRQAGKRRAPAGNGAVATLVELAGTNFFDKARTINDIITHCKHSMARSFKANEISGKLGRMVRDGELSREKNSDNQYAYKKR